MGDNYEDPDEFNFWHNLVLTDTSFETTYLIYLEAATGTPSDKNATSDTSNFVLRLVVENAPNLDP